MKHLLKATAFGLFIGFSSPYAADIPTVVEGSEEYSQEDCVASNTDDCIQAICLTSSALDCTDQCRSSAQDKCEEMAEQ